MPGRPYRGLGTIITACLLAGTGVTVGVLPAQAAAHIATCAPKIVTHVTAPGVGNITLAKAAGAGHVTLMETSSAALQVRGVAPVSKWKVTIVTADGAKVHVTFDRMSSTHSIRFYARMDSAGTRITVITVACT
jgi:hypothetical protein